ncbi:Hypothetical predicted protein, partial [Pelobates cultripes]
LFCTRLSDIQLHLAEVCSCTSCPTYPPSQIRNSMPGKLMCVSPSTIRGETALVEQPCVTPDFCVKFAMARHRTPVNPGLEGHQQLTFWVLLSPHFKLSNLWVLRSRRHPLVNWRDLHSGIQLGNPTDICTAGPA